MRRLLPMLIAATVVFAACGDGAKVADTTPSTGEASATTGLGIGAATIPTVSAECLNKPTTTSSTVPVPSFPEGKPTVEIPKTLPTKLVLTDLIPGTAHGAKAG